MKGLNFGKDAYEIIQEVFADYAYPICFGFPAGHAENNFPRSSVRRSKWRSVLPELPSIFKMIKQACK